MLSCCLKNGKIFLILPGHHRVLGIVWFRSGEEGLDTEQDRPQRHRRRPLVLQDVQADGPRHARDVGMPDFCDESYLRRIKQ